MELNGMWRVALDPEDIGLDEGWFGSGLPGAKTLPLPGSIQEHGFGDPPGPDTQWTGAIKDKSLFSDPRYEPYRTPENFKIPFWLQPLRVYRGACWFQQTVQLEDADVWMELFLERCHWFSRAWIGEQELGTRDSLCTPHVYRFRSGQTGSQRLTVRIDNRLLIDVGPNSHSVSDHTQTNWNGVIGRMFLRPSPSVQLERMEIDADPETGRVHLDLEVREDAPGAEPLELRLRVSAVDSEETTLAECTRSLDPESEAMTVKQDLTLETPVEAWSPHHPRLYQVEIIFLRCGETVLCHREEFGFVRMKTEGAQFLLNGSPLQLRGTLDCAVFPDHGYPPTDAAGWERIFRRVREYGLNHVRFHSWCPPREAFVAGDRVGIIFQIECGSWANTTSAVGNGDTIDDWLYQEGERIVRCFGNHPCFRLMAYGNEPAGPGELPGAEYLRGWLTHWKRRDPRRLHTGGAGWPRLPENDFHNLHEPRLQAWGAGLDGWLNAHPPGTKFDLEPILETLTDRPVISHEIGQWCVYPDMNEIETYQGFLKAGNIEIYRDFLERMGLSSLAGAYHMASGRLQTLCYKMEIEAALRSPSLAGFQLLGLQDFPGQGTAPVGVLDAFWEPKAYVNATEFREFCGETVLLAALDRMVFLEGDELQADLLCTHWGETDLKADKVDWQLRVEGESNEADGEVSAPPVPTGSLTALGSIQHRFAATGLPRQLELVVEKPGGKLRNRWNLFVYPRNRPEIDMGDVRVITEWGPVLTAALEAGDAVWLCLKPGDIDTHIQTGFSSIFWNTPWTRGQAPHTLGVLCNPNHPALADFPTTFHSDVQWWSILRYAAPMELDRLGWTDGGIVSLVPDWADPKPLSIAFEAKVGKSRVLVTSVDFDASEDPALRQFEYSLKRYWASAPDPDLPALSPGRLLTLFE